MRYVTNKQFIIGLLITPSSWWLCRPSCPSGALEQASRSNYYVVDDVGVLPLLEEGAPDNLHFLIPNDRDRIAEEVQEGNAAGYLLVDSTFLHTGNAYLYLSEHSTEGRGYIQAILTQFLQQWRMQEAALDWEALQYVSATAQVQVETMAHVKLPGGEEIAVSGVFVVLIYILVLSSGTMLMQSAVQEKRDRMAEVVLSSITPQTLMKGKIFGHFLLGVLQLAFWLALVIPAAIYFLDFPVWEALLKADLGMLAVFGLCGYLLYAALFVGIGATMEDIQSAGNSQGLVVMLPMLAFLFIGPVVSNPNGSVAVLASFLPFTSPVIMIMRTALTQVPLWQMAFSVGLLLLAVFAIAVMSAKIFRVGMLMYGKTASLGDIVKWLRYKEE